MYKNTAVVAFAAVLLVAPFVAAQPADQEPNQTPNDTVETPFDDLFPLQQNGTLGDLVPNESNATNQTNVTLPNATNGTNATNQSNVTAPPATVPPEQANASNVTNNVSVPAEDELAAETNVTEDIVIVASEENYPDALVASVAASKTGSPLVLTDNDTIGGNTVSALQTFDPDEVVVVGGPDVINTTIDEDLEQNGYNVTRLWGVTRYGTSVAVAEYFWPEGSDEAVLVQDDRDAENRTANAPVVAEAATIARENHSPVYLTPDGRLPAITLSSLQNMGVESVTVVGTNVTDSYRQYLEDADISVEAEIVADEREQLLTELRNVTADVTADRLVVVASEDFRYSMVAANVPNATVTQVDAANATEALVDRVNETGVEQVTVIGTETDTQAVADDLENATNVSVQVVAGPAENITVLSANVTQQYQSVFAERRDAYLAERQQTLEENAEQVRERTQRLIARADALIDGNVSGEARTSLRQAEMHFDDGDYLAARRHAVRAIHSVRLQQFEEVRTEADLQRMINLEIVELEQAVDQFQRINPRFAAQFSDLSLVRQLVIVESLQDVPQDQFGAVINETVAREQASTEEEFLDQFQDARERVQEGNFTEQNRTQVNETINETNITNQTNVTTGNETNVTVGNETNQTNTTNETNNTTVGAENESSQVVAAEQRFDYDTRCQDGDNATNASFRADGNMIIVDGQVTLPTPNYNATSNVSVDDTEQAANVTVNYTERDQPGVQCVGESNFTQTFNVSDGDWNVSLVVNVENETVLSASETVTVPGEEEEMPLQGPVNNGDGGSNAAVEVAMVDNAFQPETVDVAEGDTIVFVNNGDNTHTVTIPGLGVDEEVAPGDSVTVQADQTGTFDLICEFHEPEMTGTVNVESA